MNKAFNPAKDLEIDGYAFTRNTLRVLLHVLEEMKSEGRKSWKHEDFVHLIERLIKEAEAPLAVTETEGEVELDRDACIALGKQAFAEGVARKDNPHPEATKLNEWWDIGWHDAERAKKIAGGGIIAAVQGRRRADSDVVTEGFRVQRKVRSEITEWNDALHQYAPEGQGTIYADYDEALAMAEKLQVGTTGIVSVVSTKD